AGVAASARDGRGAPVVHETVDADECPVVSALSQREHEHPVDVVRQVLAAAPLSHDRVQPCPAGPDGELTHAAAMPAPTVELREPLVDVIVAVQHDVGPVTL